MKKLYDDGSDFSDFLAVAPTMDPPGSVSGVPREDIQPATASEAFVAFEFVRT